MKDSIIIEISGAVGGKEADLFANDLLRMYCKYAEKQKLNVDLIQVTPPIIKVSGEHVVQLFSHEAGVHRVQRVPATEMHGRIQTSTATVSVIREEELANVRLDQSDLEITACRSSGAGGQHVNKTDSKIRILHKPTGIVVECQEERSQYMNKEKALEKLKFKLIERAKEHQQQKLVEQRREQIGTADRSEKIRTYNFKENRVTDHVLGITLN